MKQRRHDTCNPQDLAYGLTVNPAFPEECDTCGTYVALTEDELTMDGQSVGYEIQDEDGIPRDLSAFSVTLGELIS